MTLFWGLYFFSEGFRVCDLPHRLHVCEKETADQEDRRIQGNQGNPAKHLHNITK